MGIMRKRKPHFKKPSAPGPVQPADPEEMSFALQVFQAGLRLRMPMQSPEKKGIEFGDAAMAQAMLESLPKVIREQFVIRDNRVAPKDTPLHRGIFGVMEHYKDHPQKDAIASRINFLLSDERDRTRWNEEVAEAL